MGRLIVANVPPDTNGKPTAAVRTCTHRVSEARLKHTAPPLTRELRAVCFPVRFLPEINAEGFSRLILVDFHNINICMENTNALFFFRILI